VGQETAIVGVGMEVETVMDLLLVGEEHQIFESEVPLSLTELLLLVEAVAIIMVVGLILVDMEVKLETQVRRTTLVVVVIQEEQVELQVLVARAVSEVLQVQERLALVVLAHPEITREEEVVVFMEVSTMQVISYVFYFIYFLACRWWRRIWE
jgi:hypothetical protein